MWFSEKATFSFRNLTIQQYQTIVVPAECLITLSFERLNKTRFLKYVHHSTIDKCVNDKETSVKIRTFNTAKTANQLHYILLITIWYTVPENDLSSNKFGLDKNFYGTSDSVQNRVIESKHMSG